MTFLYQGISTGHSQGPTEFAIVGVFDNTKVNITFPRDGMNPLMSNSRTMTLGVDRLTTYQICAISNESC